MALERGLLLPLTVRAREICPGDTRFITRYVHGGENRLRCDRETTEIIGYFLAVYANRYNIELNAVCYPGNHEHLVAHDPDARTPDFTRDLHASITKQLNATFGDEGSMWDSRQTSHVRPIRPEDTVARIAYTMANPVKHQFVKFAKSFPGLRMRWPCRPRTFKRPKGFLDADAKAPDGSLLWPETATLTMHRPKGFEHLSDNELAVLLEEACRAEEDAQREKVLAEGGTFLGRGNVLRQSRYRRPARSERSKRRGGISPRIACRDREARAAALAHEKMWYADYSECLERWVRGDRDVVFPYGTFKMRVVHRVNVAPPAT